MKSKYWIKLYHEMIDDPKVARLNDSAYRLFIECLLLAGELDEGGLLPPVEDMAWRLRKSETALPDSMTHLALAGMVKLVQHKDDERWFVTKFAERQAPSTSAQRVRAFRARKRKEPKEKEENKKQITDTDTDTYIDTYSNVTNVTNRYNDVTENPPLYDGHEENTHTENPPLYDGHEENTHTQEYQDVITAICNETKNGNALAPSADLQNFAHAIMDAGTASRISGFAEWWQTNGHYPGFPALKSMISDWKNYLSGATLKQTNSQQQGPAAAALEEYEAIRSQFNDAIS
jgi:hypothetical protein